MAIALGDEPFVVERVQVAMVQLASFIEPAAIRSNLEATNKDDVLHELVSLLFSAHPSLGQQMTRPEAFQMLAEREKLAATGVGNRAAIPHAASHKLNDLYGGFGLSKRGIDFSAIDGQPCNLFFVLLCPSARPKVRIKALSRISRLLGEKENRRALMHAGSDAEIYRILTEGDRELEDADKVSR